MTAMDALNRARLAWEATQPQLTIEGVLEQAAAGNTERHRVARGACRLLERTAPISSHLSPGPVRSHQTNRATEPTLPGDGCSVTHKGA